MNTKSKTLVKELNFELPRLRLCLFYEKCKPEGITRRITIKGPDDAYRFLKPLSLAAEEYFLTIHLSAKNQVLGVHEVSHGTISSSLVHPREVFKAAVLANSHSILLCHNHPSGGELKPSFEDMEITSRLVEVGRMMGIQVLDHVIVGTNLENGNDGYSMRENHPELFMESIL